MMTSSLPLAPIMAPNSSSPIKSSFSGQQNNNNNNYSSKIPFENSRTMDECRIEVLRKFRKEIVNNVRFSDVSRVLIACCLVSKEECFEICKLPMPKQMTQCFQKVHDIMDILVCQKAAASEKNIGNGENNGGSGAYNGNTSSNSATTERRIGSQRRVEETDKQNGLVKDIWKNFISALREEHCQLAGKMENELDKSAERRLLLKRGNSSGGGGNGGGSMRSLLRKEDIGCPRDFQHVQHFGVISDKRNKGKIRVTQKIREDGDGAPFSSLPIISTRDDDEVNFRSIDHNNVLIANLDENDEDLKEFLKRAGVTSRHLLNPVTKEIICRFIAENGGMDAIREEVRLPDLVVSTQDEMFQPKIRSTNTETGQDQDQVILRMKQTDNLASRIVCGRSNSETQLVKKEDIGNSNAANGTPPPAPPNVPFQPTPRPTSNLFYF